MKIIDISKKFFSCDVYPGDPEPKHSQACSIDKGDVCNLTKISAGAHTGTHVDAPLHFIQNGQTIENLPLEAFVGPCKVIKVPSGVITGDYVDRFFPESCQRLLIKGNSRAFFMDSSAEEAVQRGLLLIGTDALSVGSKGNEAPPHKAFLQAGVAILEGLDLSEVEPGEYFLFAPPVNYDGIEAAPARAVLVEDYIFWSKKS